MAGLVENVKEKVKTAVSGITGQPSTPGGYKGAELSAQQEKEAQYRSEAHVMKTTNDLNHNMAIVLTGNNAVELKDIGPVKMTQDHEVILRITTSGICGSDLHMYEGRTNAQSGMVLGHEMTGEVLQCGSAVKFLQPGDFVIVPFNIACGCCTNCKQQQVNCCLYTNPIQPGGIHGYSDSCGAGHTGGQAQYKVVPFADFNLVKCPDKHRACEEILDIALLPDVLPTAFHAAKEGGVCVGSIVFVAGAGPVGLATIASSFLLGASVVICGDVRPNRLENAKKMGACVIDLSTLHHEQAITEVENILSNQKMGQLKRVDVAIDCVGYSASALGEKAATSNEPTAIINLLIDLCKYGGTISIPGIYFPADPKGPTTSEKMGRYEIDFGKLWMKMINVKTGQTPVMKYVDPLMRMILSGRLDIAKYLNCKIISLEQVPEAYKSFSKGEPCKYIIVPHDDIRNSVLQRSQTKQMQMSMTKAGICPTCPSGKGVEYESAQTKAETIKPSQAAEKAGHPAGQQPKAAGQLVAEKETKAGKGTAAKNKAAE